MEMRSHTRMRMTKCPMCGSINIIEEQDNGSSVIRCYGCRSSIVIHPWEEEEEEPVD